MKGDKQIFDRFAVIFSIAIVWIYAHLLTVGGAYKNTPTKTQTSCRTDRAGIIGAAPWISVPYPFQWGAPTFAAGEAFAMMAASFVALVESTGAFYAVSSYAGATPVPPSVLSRGVGWQGVGILFSGIFGTGNGSSVSVENAGLLALTRVGSRRVVQISAGFMIFFSILGKFGAIFASIPPPIVAALYCLFFAYVGAGGLSFLQFCNLNSFRTKFVLGFSIFMGLSIPQYFNEYTSVNGYGPVHTRARWFNDMINVPSGYLIRPCEGGGLIIHIVDHLDLEPLSVPEVLRPLYESSTLLSQRATMAALSQLRQISQEVSQPTVTGWGRRPAALRALRQRLNKVFNEAVNGFIDEGWSMIESDGIDDVTILVNSSPGKLMGVDPSHANGFPSMSNAVLCAKASMLLQDVPPAMLVRFLREHRSEWADSGIDSYSAAAIKAGPYSLPGTLARSFGGQVILPLAHTIEHEEFMEVIKLECRRSCFNTGEIVSLVRNLGPLSNV